jgi:tungstate transport system substrate-binding protein
MGNDYDGRMKMGKVARRLRLRGTRIGVLASLVVGIALVVVPAAPAASKVIVQGTTDVRDAGLLEEVIEPGFSAVYPEYELKYVPVGTGVAIANAKAGGGDALMVHAPSQEKTFVEEGYSLEPRGRAVFYSDYVIPGPLDDPAEVLTKAPHNAALAYELIAKAGEEGKANFISRGDNSGTNTQEKAIWKLTKVELNKLGEPGPAGTETDASWYHKAVLGQAETLKVTDECPTATFTGGGCYEMTDRGTYNRLVANGSVTHLKVVTEKNEASAPGGSNLLTNPFSFYIVNPAKVTSATINVKGAEALRDYLTSEAFQSGLASFPNTTSPAFFEDAHPTITATQVSGTFDLGAKFTIAGTVTGRLPGAQPVSGVPMNVQQQAAGSTEWKSIASTVTDDEGGYSVEAPVVGEGPLRVEMPNTNEAWPSLAIVPLISSGGLTQTFVGAGEVKVPSSSGGGATPPKTSTVAPLQPGSTFVKKPTIKGRTVTLRGTLSPAVSPSGAATLVVQGRRLGTKGGQFHALKKAKPKSGATYTLTVKLKPGKWKLRVIYSDPGVTAAPATSRAVSVSVA